MMLRSALAVRRVDPEEAITWSSSSGPPSVICLVMFTVLKRRARCSCCSPYARAEGLSSVNLTTGADDLASQRVIQANGGTVIERFFKPAAYGEAESLRFPPMRIVLSIAVVVLVIASNAPRSEGYVSFPGFVEHGFWTPRQHQAR